jgi:hypothetical protein
MSQIRGLAGRETSCRVQPAQVKIKNLILREISMKKALTALPLIFILAAAGAAFSTDIVMNTIRAAEPKTPVTAPKADTGVKKFDLRQENINRAIGTVPFM